MKPGPGTRLGPYELVSRLGVGGMGEVWRARDTRLPRDVAVKILPAHLASDPGRRARLEREAAAIAKLSHPHICALYDVGRQNDRFYLVMELVDGETLGTRLPADRCRSTKRCASASKSRRRSNARTARAWSIATSSRAT